jgi:low affinity Fe/Cu permease
MATESTQPKTAKDASERSAYKQAAQTPGHQGWFSKAACGISHLAGKPATFLIAAGSVVIWAFSGPFFGFSDTWQLVINTSTTIITFLMVFLIQNTQNRDTIAIQIKLAELIIRLEGADNKLATAEDLSDEELEQLHRGYQDRAEETLKSLDRRRGDKPKAA